MVGAYHSGTFFQNEIFVIMTRFYPLCGIPGGAKCATLAPGALPQLTCPSGTRCRFRTRRGIGTCPPTANRPAAGRGWRAASAASGHECTRSASIRLLLSTGTTGSPRGPSPQGGPPLRGCSRGMARRHETSPGRFGSAPITDRVKTTRSLRELASLPMHGLAGRRLGAERS